MRRHLALEKVISPVVTNMDYEFVGLEYVSQHKRPFIRLYIDKPGGISAEDCGRASRQVNAVLSVEGGFAGDYILEVSSPGLDRLLFTEAQLEQQLGKRISVHLVAPIDGRKNFKGRLERVEKGQIALLVDDKEVILSFSDIDRARLVPEW